MPWALLDVLYILFRFFGSKRKEALLKQPRAIVKIINAQIETFNSSADYHLKFLTLTFSTWEQLCSLVFEKKVYRIHDFLQLSIVFVPTVSSLIYLAFQSDPGMTALT